MTDNLQEQLINISKAGAFDVLTKQYGELKSANRKLADALREMVALVEYIDLRSKHDPFDQQVIANKVLKENIRYY